MALEFFHVAAAEAIPAVLFCIDVELIGVLPPVNGTRPFEALGSLLQGVEQAIMDQHHFHADLLFDGFEIHPFSGHKFSPPLIELSLLEELYEVFEYLKKIVKRQSRSCYPRRRVARLWPKRPTAGRPVLSEQITMPVILSRPFRSRSKRLVFFSLASWFSRLFLASFAVSWTRPCPSSAL